MTCRTDSRVKRSRKLKDVISTRYSSMIASSKKRGMDAPSFTLKELKRWAKEQPNRKQLMKEWKKSGYLTKKALSIDRVDRTKPYTLDNIALVTWTENNTKGIQERCKGVKRVGANNDIDVEVFESRTEAARAIGVSVSAISKAIRTGGKYKDNYWYNV